MEHAIEQATKVLADNWRNMHTNESLGQQRMLARALADAGLLAPAPLTEEWAARYVNGGGSICRTRDEAEAELDRMTRDSHRHRVDEPPAPEIAGIYARYVTDWAESGEL